MSDEYIVASDVPAAIENGKSVWISEIGYAGDFIGSSGKVVIAIAMEPQEWAHMLTTLEFMRQVHSCPACGVNAEAIFRLLNRNGWHAHIEHNDEGRWRFAVEQCPNH